MGAPPQPPTSRWSGSAERQAQTRSLTAAGARECRELARDGARALDARLNGLLAVHRLVGLLECLLVAGGERVQHGSHVALLDRDRLTRVAEVGVRAARSGDVVRMTVVLGPIAD